MIKQVIWSSTIDWKDNNCSVLFLDGCNFKCSYCHNKELVHLPSIDTGEVLSKLEERKPFIDHVILSGGEPTISRLFNPLVNNLHHLEFKVGIHTNGSNFLAYEMNKDRIDFVGLDFKCGTYRYHEFCEGYIAESLMRYFYDFEQGDVDYEVRTTLDAGMTIDELKGMADILKQFKIKEWVLQPEFEMKEGKYNRKLYYDKFWYNSTLEKLNNITPTRYRGIMNEA